MTQMLLGHQCKLRVVLLKLMFATSFSCCCPDEGLQLSDGCYINPGQDVMPHLSLQVVGSVTMSLDMHPHSLKSSYSK